ncbi:MAG: hypothetical protein GY773_05620 [Actinomycetia bacterium]|nr:hypothetical protein [Actinomycetes bacterium]
MIMLIVSAVALLVVAAVGGLVFWLGWFLGLVAGLGGLTVIAITYILVARPWHLRWGTTDDEVDRPMPGDELVPDTRSATRAITIDAPAEAVWPWLVQIGFDKAGWYSYDWIDNDFKPSADQIIEQYQDLNVGDKILMMPTMGFVVAAIEPNRHIVSLLEDESTSWCLALYPTETGGTRLVSRWRPKLDMSPASFFLSALAEPGTFIMEQKMLRNIRDRANHAALGGN